MSVFTRGILSAAASSQRGLTTGTVAEPVRMSWRDVHEQAKRMAAVWPPRSRPAWFGRDAGLGSGGRRTHCPGGLAEPRRAHDAAVPDPLGPIWRSGSTTPCEQSGWSMPTWSSSASPSRWRSISWPAMV